MRTKLEKELEARIKDQVEVRITQAAIGFYEGTLSDGSRYSAVLKSLTVDHHHMNFEVDAS